MQGLGALPPARLTVVVKISVKPLQFALGEGELENASGHADSAVWV